MAHLDRFVELIFRAGADRLVLATNEKALLTSGEQHRTVTAQPTTLPQIMQLLREIAPPDLSERMSRADHCDFIYASPSGSVRVHVQRDNGSLQVRLEPQRRAPHPVPSASEPPPSATLPFTHTAVPADPASIAEPAETQRIQAVQQDGQSAAPTRPEPSGRGVLAAPARKDPVALAPQASGTPAIESYLQLMLREKCSDLHLSSECPPLFRKDAEMVTLGSSEPLPASIVQDLLFEITPEIQRAQFEAQHDVDFSYEIQGVARFRCNLFLDRRGPGGVFRVIPARIPSAESLGLTRHMLDLCNLTKGLVLVTGPTGSGKSTTLAAMIDFINRNRGAHIITVEDPIEFVHENNRCLVNQREIGGHTNSFKSALRAALREDPDIVLVGEMRDLETMEIAIETAETGHLVFGTLHTNTAASTVDRIIDQFPGDRQNQVRSMLADSLKGVIAQTLCKKKGGGLVAAHEVLLVNAAVSNLIREGKTFQITTIIQTGRAAGMITLNDSLLELVKRDLVDPRDAFAKAVARSEFRALLERHHFRLDPE